MRKLYIVLSALVIATASYAQTACLNHLVISQIYGGGGNASATYQNDFIEIFNPTNSPVSLNGYSVQYAAGTSGGSFNATNKTDLPNVTLQPGQYFLIQEFSQGAVGSSLPSPDLIVPNASAINLAAGAGKVALVNSTTALSGTCPTGAPIVDFVGYGTSNTFCFEGTGPAPTPSATSSIVRKNGGLQDTNDNTADFNSNSFSSGIQPRNTSTTRNHCTFIKANPTTINGLNYSETAGPSVAQSFTVAGTSTVGNLTATASTNFEVSLSQNSGFSSALTLPSTGGTVYVRLVSGLMQGNYSGNIVIGGGGAAAPDNATVIVNGTVAPQGSLPVKLANLKAVKKSQSVEISFSNVTEKDVIHYSIERSSNGQTFTELTQLAPKNNGGQADYQFTDGAPLNGINIYRIKATEATGKVSYSVVIRIQTHDSKTGLTVYPNPVINHQLGFQMNVVAGNYTLIVRNTVGQEITKQTINHTGGTYTQTLQLENVRPGLYYLEILGAKEQVRKSFLVQ